MTTGDLLHLLLIGSDNAAARVLARVSPYGSSGFIERMNAKAQELGLESTSYADPSGLLADNASSAYDLGAADHLRLRRRPHREHHADAVLHRQRGRHQITIHSTNQLVMKGDVDVQAGKTGFITKAGYCLATLLRLPQGGPEVAVVVLGAKSNPGTVLGDAPPVQLDFDEGAGLVCTGRAAEHDPGAGGSSRVQLELGGSEGKETPSFSHWLRLYEYPRCIA